MEEQLLDAWGIHNRIHLYLLGALTPEALHGVSASRGRSVGEQFAHLHNVRLMWLKEAAPDLMEGLGKIDKPDAHDPARLRGALEASAAAIATLLRRSLQADGRIRGFKPHAGAFLGYLISHESHHRGQIVLTLKQAGSPLDRKVAYGLWEWGAR